jgi:hypothetical protein
MLDISKDPPSTHADIFDKNRLTAANPPFQTKLAGVSNAAMVSEHMSKPSNFLGDAKVHGSARSFRQPFIPKYLMQ